MSWRVRLRVECQREPEQCAGDPLFICDAKIHIIRQIIYNNIQNGVFNRLIKGVVEAESLPKRGGSAKDLPIFVPRFRAISSVGSERSPHTREVTGSSPVLPTPPKGPYPNEAPAPLPLGRGAFFCSFAVGDVSLSNGPVVQRIE